jgi:hypothetical protein
MSNNMIPPTVVNKNRQSFDIYIGRGSKWGNPYHIGELSRDEVVNKYRDWLLNQIEKGCITHDDVLSLNNKKLGCFCKPKRCHGDVIVEVFIAICEFKKK